MEKILYSLVFMALLFVMPLHANHHEFDVEKTKIIEELFEVNRDALLSVNNRHGDIELIAWDDASVKIEITVKAMDNDEERAQRRLDAITFDIDISKSEVAITTNYDELNWKVGGFKIFNRGFGDNHHETEVKIKVWLPNTMELELVNKFGNIALPDWDGDAEIDLSYGDLKAGMFSSEDVYIDLSFGNGNVDRINKGELDISYSNFELDGATELILECGFSDVVLGNVDILEIDVKYGSLEMDEVVDLQGDAKFSDLDMDKLEESIDLDIQYGDTFEIDFIPATFKDIDIDGQFVNVRLNFDDESSYELDAEASFGNIDIPDLISKVAAIKEKSFGQGESINATIGTANGKRVKLDFSYGNIDIRH